MKLSYSIQLLFLVCLLLSGFWFVTSSLTGLLLIVATVVACQTIFTRQTFQAYGFTKLMLLYLAWLFVVTVNSHVPNTSMMKLCILAGMPIMYLVASNMLNLAALWQQLRLIIFVIAVGFALLVIWQVSQHFNADGSLSDRNAFAAQTNLIWFPAVFLFVSAQVASKRSLSIMLGLGLYVISVALFATSSRGGILIWALLLPFMLWAVYKQTNSKQQIFTVFVIATLAYTTSALFLDSNVADRSFQFAPSSRAGELSKDSSTTARLLLWQSTIKMTQAHPFTGTGWGTFHIYYPTYRNPLEHNTAGKHTHNDYLEFSAEGGVIALLLLLSIKVKVLLQLRKCYQHKMDTNYLEAISLLLGALAIFIHASINFIFCYAIMNIMAGLYLARVATLIEIKRSVKVSNFSQIRPSVKKMLAGFIIFLTSMPYLLNFVSQAYLNKNPPNQKLANLIVAIRPQEIVAQLAILKPAVSMLSHDDISYIGDINTQKKILVETLKRLDFVRANYANNADIGTHEAKLLIRHHALLDSTYQSNGASYIKAQLILEENLRADPFHVNSIITISRLQVIKGDRHGALEILNNAINNVLIRRDQQLIIVEILRQLATPRVIAELDNLENQLRAVQTKYTTDNTFTSAKLPANFYENIDLKLERIKKQIAQKS